MNKGIVFATIMAVITLSFGAMQSVLAIGLVSDPIELDDVLRGQEIRDELRMQNSEKESVKYSLSASGDISEWVTFYEDSVYSIPITEVEVAAESKGRVYLIIKMPDDIPNGEYEGGLSIKYNPGGKDQTSQASTNVSQKATREVFLKVTDNEIIDFDVSVTPQTYTLKENEPLKVNAFYYNKGNISVKPDLQVKVKKDGKVLFNVLFPYPEDEESVKPLVSKTISTDLPMGGLELGEYKAEAEVSLNGEVVHEDDFSFIIESASDDSGSGPDIKDAGVDTMKYALGIGAVLIILSLVVIITRKNKKKDK